MWEHSVSREHPASREHTLWKKGPVWREHPLWRKCPVWREHPVLIEHPYEEKILMKRTPCLKRTPCKNSRSWGVSTRWYVSLRLLCGALCGGWRVTGCNLWYLAGVCARKIWRYWDVLRIAWGGRKRKRVKNMIFDSKIHVLVLDHSDWIWRSL
jgi:hypothetical protein